MCGGYLTTVLTRLRKRLDVQTTACSVGVGKTGDFIVAIGGWRRHGTQGFGKVPTACGIDDRGRRYLQTYCMYPDVDGEDRQIPLLEPQIHRALAVVREPQRKLSSIKGTGLRCTWL